MTSGATVAIVCAAKGCNRVLKQITEFPEKDDPRWSDAQSATWIEPCMKHGGIPQTIADADERRASRGLPPVNRERIFHVIPWSELRIDYLRSAKTGRVVRHYVKPRGSL